MEFVITGAVRYSGSSRSYLFLNVILSLFLVVGGAVVGRAGSKSEPKSASEAIIRAEMQILAGDSLEGRGSGTRNELRAAQYVASRLKEFGIQPLGDSGGYIHMAAPNDSQRTWNVYGMLPGADRDAKSEVILLSAHLDHLGIGSPVNGDSIYNGADDDASGVIAVLELARILSKSAPYPRTIAFTFFGTEELGGFGNRDFLAKPPFPLKSIVANLEFEMIGRPDAAVASDVLWLTGYERSDLGDKLHERGAKLVADPHPAEHFFKRSDNYALARKGIIAQTVSSFGLHHDYHQPSDEPSTIDYAHMTRAITSMIEPIQWLSTSSFVPRWREGMDPSQPKK